MGVFSNSLNGPMSSRKLFGIVVYAVVAIISIWATSESINSSFEIPVVISYLVGAAFILLSAMLLGVLKGILDERRISIVKFAFVLFTFLILWGVSLLTNTHKLFTQLKLADIRKNEMDIAYTELKSLEGRYNSVGKGTVKKYEQLVSDRIMDYKKEVENAQNCGHGEIAGDLLKEVKRVMPGSDINRPSGNWKCKVLANRMEELLRKQLSDRTQEMYATIGGGIECRNEERKGQLLERLEANNKLEKDMTSVEVKQTLADVHGHYDEVFLCYEERHKEALGTIQPFIPDSNRREFIQRLDIPVPSIDLEKISSLIPFVKAYPKETPGLYWSSFFMSLAIAFILDLAGFVVVYYVILKEEE